MTFRTQEEIMQYWPSKWDVPMVSIRCITYNHEPFIAQALNSFLMQKTNFPFEIVVHDDASSDKTADIIREYEKNYPNIIKPIYEEENQYSKNVAQFRKIVDDACRGKYIAYCEGDDYWIDPNKLQMQVDWLESHPDYTMCCSDAVIESPDGILDWHRYENDCDIPVKDMILGGGSFIQTATLVYRRNLLNKYPDECIKCYVGDYPLQLWAVLNGKVRYFFKKTATYRFLHSGSWSQKTLQASISYHFNHKKSILKMLDKLDSLSNKKHHSIFAKKQTECLCDLLSINDLDTKLFKITFQKTIRNLNFNNKIKLFLKLHKNIPFISKVLSYINQGLSYIKRPLNLFDNWASLGRLNWMPDKWYLSLMFRSQMGYWMDWKHPKTFNEKLQWLKIHNRNPLYTKLVDKYEVRKYIAEKIGEEYLIPLLGVWNSPDEIDFDQLPNQFVLKCTHDSGSVIICKNKPFFDKKAAQKRLERSLSKNYYYYAREWPYKNVTPRIIAEKYMVNTDGSILNDYKFQVFNGKIQNCFVCSNRFSSKGLHVTFYDNDWNILNFTKHYPKETNLLKKPTFFKEMIETSEKVAKGFPFVRVDFYETDSNFFIGELTFYPGAGFEKFSPAEWDFKMGTLLTIQ